jgi:hypothetical protein
VIRAHRAENCAGTGTPKRAAFVRGHTLGELAEQRTVRRSGLSREFLVQVFGREQAKARGLASVRDLPAASASDLVASGRPRPTEVLAYYGRRAWWRARSQEATCVLSCWCPVYGWRELVAGAGMEQKNLLPRYWTGRSTGPERPPGCRERGSQAEETARGRAPTRGTGAGHPVVADPAKSETTCLQFSHSTTSGPNPGPAGLRSTPGQFLGPGRRSWAARQPQHSVRYVRVTRARPNSIA